MNDGHSEREQGTRAQNERQQRRRRGDGNLSASVRLYIPPEIEARLKREQRTVRWVNDQDNRIALFTQQDDYDPVEGVAPVPVGTDASGKPIMAHCLSKPDEFIREDREKADARLKAQEEALFRRPDAADQQGQGRNPNPATAERYVDRSSGIRRGNQILE